MLTQVHGHREDKPSILGKPNGADAIQVYATGLYEGVRKGLLQWVTGDAVDAGIERGLLIPVEQAEEDLTAQIEADAETARTRLRDHSPTPAGSSFQPSEDLVPVPEATVVDRALADMSKADLVKIAQAVELEGRSAMDKSELYEHLRQLPDVADHIDAL